MNLSGDLYVAPLTQPRPRSTPASLSPVHVSLKGGVDGVHLLLLHGLVLLRHLLERPHQRLVLPCRGFARRTNMHTHAYTAILSRFHWLTRLRLNPRSTHTPTHHFQGTEDRLTNFQWSSGKSDRCQFKKTHTHTHSVFGAP